MNKLIVTMLIVLAFSVGYLTANSAVLSKPTEVVLSSFNKKGIEKLSPQDRVAEGQIIVTDKRVVLNIQDASWTTFTDTNSMDPVLDIGANGIELKPEAPQDMKAGDIISYYSRYGLVVHRVVKTGYDEQGWYAITKGDNNPLDDPEKIRFGQVQGVLVAVIY